MCLQHEIKFIEHDEGEGMEGSVPAKHDEVVTRRERAAQFPDECEQWHGWWQCSVAGCSGGVHTTIGHCSLPFQSRLNTICGYT